MEEPQFGKVYICPVGQYVLDSSPDGEGKDEEEKVRRLLVPQNAFLIFLSRGRDTWTFEVIDPVSHNVSQATLDRDRMDFVYQYRELTVEQLRRQFRQ